MSSKSKGKRAAEFIMLMCLMRVMKNAENEKDKAPKRDAAMLSLCDLRYRNVVESVMVKTRIMLIFRA